MLGIHPLTARITWTVLLIGLLVLMMWQARETIIVFTLALFLAYMLSPLVDMVQRFLPPRVSRNLSLTFVYVILIAVLSGVGFWIGSAIADEASNLADSLPKLIKSNDPLASLPLPGWLGPLRGRILAALRDQLSSLNENAFTLFRKALQEILKHANIVLMIVLIPILSFFFLKDGAVIRDEIVAATTTGKDSRMLDQIFEDIHSLLGKYIRALVMLSAATFTCYTLFLTFTGGQYAVLLGGVAAVLEFIPVVGPLAAAVIIILVEGFAGYGHVLLIVGFILLYRTFQDYVLAPYLMSSGVELHPLLVLFGVLAGEQIGGVPGMFFSVPVLAILRVLYVRLKRGRAVQTLPA